MGLPSKIKVCQDADVVPRSCVFLGKNCKKSRKLQPIDVNTLRSKHPNDFQLGLETSREFMKSQVGVRLAMPRSAFSGYWDAPEVCQGKILGPSYEGRFVAEALFDGESAPTRLTSSSLMLHETTVHWQSALMNASDFHNKKNQDHVKHQHAFERAKEMMGELIRRKQQELEQTYVLTLDGHGSNQTAFREVLLESLPMHQHPTVLTFEMKADVALAQRIAFGWDRDVQFTGGDPHFASKSLFGHSSTPTLEHLLIKENSLLPDSIKDKTVFLYMDYCGGPLHNHDSKSSKFMERAVAHLPNLEMVAFTMARRNHGALDVTFDEYIPPPYGFRLWKTFTSNPRILCKVYARDYNVTRTLAIPGYWWGGSTASQWKHKTFTGILLDKPRKGMQRVYIPFDEDEYSIRIDAVKAYSKKRTHHQTHLQ